MDVLRFFLVVMSLLLTTPVAIYCLEVIVGCWPRRRRPATTESAGRRRVAVLVPAHNERNGIAATLRSIQSQLRPDDRLLVVADNCTDDTAIVARESGATVWERSDEYRRGKGFALAFGLDHLLADPPEVVLFFDADCRLLPDTVERLVETAQQRQRPVQALYLCQPTAAGDAQQLISGLAFRFKNLIRMSGMARLGGPCHLTGSGMGLPWSLIDKVAWATGNVVEDMQLGIDYALAGYPPLLVTDAQVRSDLPTSKQGQLSQRRRWEHGFLLTAMTQLPQLVSQSVERRSWSLLVLALDMAVPPLALLSAALTAGWLVAVLIWLVGLGVGPLVVITLAGLAFTATTLLGWAVHCRDLTPIRLFLQVPGYVLAKLPLYLEFFTRRQQEWVRAERPAKP